MKRPIESDYISQVAYTRALEAYCDRQDRIRRAEEAFEASQQNIQSYLEKDNSQQEQSAERGGEPASVTYQEVTDTMNSLWYGTLEQVQMAQLLENKKLYTTPPQRTWVGLTDEGEDAAFEQSMAVRPKDASNKETRRLYARAIETKLKEKNT